MGRKTAYKLGKMSRLPDGSVHRLLQLRPHGGLARPHSFFNFPLGQRLTFRLPTRFCLHQPIFLLKLPHKGFLAAVVLTVRNHLSVLGNPVDDEVHMLMRGIRVAGRYILIVGEAHMMKVLFRHFTPLVVGQALPRRE